MLDPGPFTVGAQTYDARVKRSTLAGDHEALDTHGLAVPGATFPTIKDATAPKFAASSGTTLPPTSAAAPPMLQPSAAPISQPTETVTQPMGGSSAASTLLPPKPSTTPNGSSAAGATAYGAEHQRIRALIDLDTTSDPGHAMDDDHINPAGADLHDALLAVLADALDDLERVRIATQNRVRSLQQVKGLEGTKFEANLADLLDSLAALEKKATLDLQRAMRLHPLGAHVKATKGLGEKQAARLLAAIGNPADRPNPAKLWQYAGHGDPLRSRKRKGQVVEFNPTAKMRVHLCAESAMKTRCGACTEAAKATRPPEPEHAAPWQPPHDCTCPTTHPLRAVYDRERLKWADRDTSDGHKHNHALRIVGKTILLDLWKAARAAA